MNMTDMVEEAQEICEKARASVATEDCMDAAYKLCDLQVLLVRMEYEAGWDPVVRAVEEMAPKAPAEPKIGDVYSGQTTVSVKDNLNSAHVVCSPEEMRQATVSEHRFDNQPNPKYDAVKNPAHYCEGRKYEPWDVSIDWGLDCPLSYAIKYIARAGRKQQPGMTMKQSEVQDLEKAINCLKKRLEVVRSSDDD